MSACGCNENPIDETRQSENTPPDLRVVNIDFLFLDLSVCTRCQGTEGSIEDSLNQVSGFLKEIGYEVKVNKAHIETEDQAVEHRFVSSPTIRVNGRDIQMEIRESHCSSCSSLTDGASVDCRLWYYKGKEYSVPPREMIINAVMNEIYNRREPGDIAGEEKHFALPDNLHEYFVNKDALCGRVGISPKTNCCGNESNSCC